MADKSKQSVLISFWDFIKKPRYEIAFSKQKPHSKGWDVLRLWSLLLFIALLGGILISIALLSSGYEMEKHAIVDLMMNYPIYILIILAVLWAPVVEELTFRMGMKYSPFRMSFTLGFLLILIYNILAEIWPQINLPGLFVQSKILEIAFSLIFVVGIGIIAGFIFRKFFNKELAEKIYSKRFVWIFYAIALVFALLHLTNFENLGQIWFLIPLLIFPQFVLALTLGYVRMKYGLGWAIFNHLIHNGILLIPTVLMSYLSKDLMQSIENQTLSSLEGVSGRDLTILIIMGWGAMIFGIFILVLLIHLIREAVKSRK